MVSVLLVIGYQFLVVNAQTLNPVVITWQANNFYPADFGGRALPSPGTPVTLSAEIIQNNKLLDLSQATFLWYADETLFARGVGLKETTLKINKSPGDYSFVRVAVQINNSSFENSLRIYAQAPTVVIEGNFPNQTIRAGSQTLLRAMPYFFNVSSLADLGFSWLINDKIQNSSQDNQLLLSIGPLQGNSDAAAQISVAVQNIVNALETASNRIILNIR